MRWFKTAESIGLHLGSHAALACVWGLPRATDYSTYDTHVRHVRIFGLVFGYATWE